MYARESISQLIQDASEDSLDLSGQLSPILYDQPRQLGGRMMAKLPPDQTLQPTALVHETYVRFIAVDDSHWQSCQHFFRAAARAMRFILVEQARRKTSAKHAAVVSQQDPDELSIETSTGPVDLLALHEALEDLEKKQPCQARLVELRFFAGLTETETAEVPQLSRTSVAREWRYARFWLYQRIKGKDPATS